MISVITINKDSKEGLRKTIESVISQTYFSGIEYIIIDGASTDGSVDVIKEYKDKINFWSSKPDKGIYDAMNKGLKYATGDYVLFLNSGDFLNDAYVIEKVFPYLKDGKYDVLSGDETKIGDGKIMNILTPDVPDEQFFYLSALPHQATFVKRELQKPFKTKYEIINDWVFLRELILEKGAKYKHIPVKVDIFALDGLSYKNSELALNEKENYYLKKKLCQK